MGLIKCPDCGKEISEHASQCINCGCPIVAVNNQNPNGNEVDNSNSDDAFKDDNTINNDEKVEQYEKDITYSSSGDTKGHNRYTLKEKVMLLLGMFLIIFVMIVAFIPSNSERKHSDTTYAALTNTRSDDNELTNSEARSVFTQYLSSYRGSDAVEDALMSRAPSGTESLSNIRVATIDDDRGMHDFDYKFYGTFTAYDRYGEIIDYYTFEMDGWVDNDGSAGVYTGATVRRQ